MQNSAVDMFFAGLMESLEYSVPTPVAAKLLRLKDLCKEQEKNNMISFANDYAYFFGGSKKFQADIHYENSIENKHNENL
jgi:hypothetical protein